MKAIFWIFFLLCFPVIVPESMGAGPKGAPLKLGAERMEVVTRLLKGKQVGLVVNQTSVI